MNPQPQDGAQSRAEEAATPRSEPPAAAAAVTLPSAAPARPAAGQSVAAGFVGGAVAAAAVAGAILLWGPLADLPRRLDTMEANAGGAAPRSALDALDKRAAALEQKTGALAAALEPVARQSEAAEATAKEAAAKAAAATSLADQVKAASQRAALASPAGEPSADTTALAGRLDKLEGSLASLDSLGQRLSASEAGLAKLTAQPPATQAAADALAAKLATLQQQLGQTAQDEAQAAGPLVGLALLTRQDLAAGKPIGKPLQALKALGAPEADLAPLSAYADKGAPSTAELSASLADLMRRTAPKPAASTDITGSIWDRVATQASHLVKVHPVGQPAPVEDIAEVQSALAAGRLGDAMATWDKLPADIRQRTQPWADEARARLAAAQAADSLVASSVERLASASRTTGAPSR